MQKSDKRIHDPANYRAMSEPHESADAANTALEAFFEEVAAARKKHRIRDVVVACAVNVKYDEGEGAAMTHFSFGSAAEWVGLAAYAYGALQAEEREARNILLAGRARQAK